LLTEGGDFDKLGRGAVWRGEIDPCIHQNHIFRVRPLSDKVLPEFLSSLLGSDRGKRYFLQAAKQTTGIATINKTQLRGFPVLLPPLSLQEQFEKLVGRHGHVTSRIEGRFCLAENLFHSLVQRAFRGEL
jgi:type I restriction enzyme S subunit